MYLKRRIAVVQTGGKTTLAVAWAILEELGVPSFVVFDGDRGIEARGKRKNKSQKDIGSDVANATRWNKNLLSLLGAPEEDWPATGVHQRHAVFEDRLESELESTWPEAVAHVQRLTNEPGEWRRKPKDCYREAARDANGDVQKFVAEVIAKIKRLR